MFRRATDTRGSHRQTAITTEAAKRSATAKYLQRVRQVLKSQLNGKNNIQAINTYALPVIRYPTGVISWPLEEMQAAGVNSRKLLTMHGGFHPKFIILRLYANRGGEGTSECQTTIQKETAGLQEYTDDLRSACLRQLKPSMEEELEGWVSPCTVCAIAELKRWLKENQKITPLAGKS